MKVILGSAGDKIDEWLSTDKDTLDITKLSDWQKHFELDSIDMMLAEHVWEHLSIEDGILAAENCYKYLRRRGHIRIAVPDGYSPHQDYIEHVKVGKCGHMVLYNHDALGALLTGVGFVILKMEYWKEDGAFFTRPWKEEDGHIKRSVRNDWRNVDGKVRYTSLIIDAGKGEVNTG